MKQESTNNESVKMQRVPFAVKEPRYKAVIDHMVAAIDGLNELSMMYEQEDSRRGTLEAMSDDILSLMEELHEVIGSEVVWEMTGWPVWEMKPKSIRTK